jgi:hypothetical protein
VAALQIGDNSDIEPILILFDDDREFIALHT